MNAIMALNNRLRQLSETRRVLKRVREAVEAVERGEIEPSRAWEVIRAFEGSRRKSRKSRARKPRQKEAACGAVFTAIFKGLPGGLQINGSRVIARSEEHGEVYHVAAGDKVPLTGVPVRVQKVSREPARVDRGGGRHFVVRVIRLDDEVERPGTPEERLCEAEKATRPTLGAVAKVHGNGRPKRKPRPKAKPQTGRFLDPDAATVSAAQTSCGNVLSLAAAKADPTIDWERATQVVARRPERGVAVRGTRKKSASSKKLK